jgi:ADP-heptose:LPS heptosyltransferase
MQHVSLEQLADLLKVISITQSVDSGFAITHIGHIEGVPTVAISNNRSNGDGYIIQ